MKNKFSCKCRQCKECCWNSQGWFGSIEEVERAAKLMKMPLKEFAQEYLIREWWSDKDDISIPSPRKNFNRCKNQKQKEIFNKLSLLRMEMARNGKGFVKASFGHNLMSGWACIFLDDNDKCLIHQSKPEECRKSFGCKSQPNIREKLPSYWKKHQDWIKKLI